MATIPTDTGNEAADVLGESLDGSPRCIAHDDRLRRGRAIQPRSSPI